MDRTAIKDIGMTVRTILQNQSFSRRPSGRGGAMVWVAISYNGKMEIQEATCWINAEGYVRNARKC